MLVIGIGNEYRSDDGVGLAVAGEIAGMGLEGVSVIKQSGSGTELLETLRDADDVILVDAVCSTGVAGRIHRIDPHETQDWDRYVGVSTHGFGVGHAIRMAETMNLLPARIALFGIEGTNFEPGNGLSAEVETAAKVVINLVHMELVCMSKE